ncbi:pentapeptide repeat-containing protein [Streptomyces sp. NPDC048612]|uniref:pentapeptide repeat-containing protein n=1 Tax=Streptomyces sp. NPDC048612 TaxID=3365579 RepID=UPI00371B5127
MFWRRMQRRGLDLWWVSTVLVLTFTVVVAANAFYTGWDLLDVVMLSFGVVAWVGAVVVQAFAERRRMLRHVGLWQMLRPRRGLRLWPVGTVLVLTFTVAVLVAATAFYTGWDLLGARGLKPEHRIDAKTLFELVKLSFGVVAGAGALVALVVAYRRQRVDEDGALREATRLHTERFTTAVSQLGDDSAAVRLGGVHALAGLADDAPTPDLRQTCIDVLCAYVRLPYTAEADLPASDVGARHTYLAVREVRNTIIRLVRDHLRLPPEHPHAWQGHDLDFTGVTFDGADFSGATFAGGKVNFSGATFASGEVNFEEAAFSSGTVTFDRATFAGAIVSFDRATFSSAVNFDSARFSSGWVSFGRAAFFDGLVEFVEAAFSSGTVTFDRATFSSAVNFDRGVTYSGAVNFDRSTFSGGTVDFTNATGPIPSGLDPWSGQPMPTGVVLPPAWTS